MNQQTATNAAEPLSNISYLPQQIKTEDLFFLEVPYTHLLRVGFQHNGRPLLITGIYSGRERLEVVDEDFQTTGEIYTLRGKLQLERIGTIVKEPGQEQTIVLGHVPITLDELTEKLWHI
jgi:hypothetical protein